VKGRTITHMDGAKEGKCPKCRMKYTASFSNFDKKEI
jgi:hypothetical protein